MIRTFLVATSLALAVVLLLPWLVLWSVISGKPDRMYSLAMKIIRFETRLLGIRLRVEGIKDIPPAACVFVANHASNIDPMVMIPQIPRRVRILVKQELFRIPIFSTAMRLAQFIPVDRGEKESTTSAISTAVENLKRGFSYVIFAEGTRSPDGRMRPFKRGAFTMAIEAGVPVVPVSIGGTQHALAKGKRVVRQGEVTVRFGSAVDGASYRMEQRPEMIARVERLVASGLPADQQP
jgi:1-acyl-sn-glycerol-3-phosphate acyltransferase